MRTGLYVHIPFCVQKCAYCDFPSSPKRYLAAAYLAALAQEMAMYRGPVTVNTVYVGGGTPTCLTPDELERLLAILHRFFCIDRDAEFTVEANPGTVTPQKLRVLRQGGVNRLSFGVQAFQPGLLSLLGRMHKVEDSYAGFVLARERGFTNVNIDLMYGLPEQTLEQWRETLLKTVMLGPEHIAAYGLKVEEGTVFYRKMRQGTLQLPDEETEVAMLELARQLLEEAGYHQYEISNYARRNYVSRHNLRYWRNETYIGVGAAAWSYWLGCRRGNTADVERYIHFMENGESAVVEQEKPDAAASMRETMILGLRLIEGVDRKRFILSYGLDPVTAFAGPVKKMQGWGMLEVGEDAVRLTRRGLLLANEVFAEFL